MDDPVGDPTDVGGVLADLASLVADVVGLTSAMLLRTDGTSPDCAGPADHLDVRGLPLPDGDDAVVVPDTRADPRTVARPDVREGRLGAYIALPVRGRSAATTGILILSGPTARPLPIVVVSLLQRFAVLFGAGLDVAAEYDRLDSDRQRWALAVEAGGVGSFDWDLVTDRLDWDAQLMALFGYGDGETFVPHIDSFTARLHPEDVAPTEAIIAEAIAVSGRYRAEYRVVWPDGTVRWVAARGQVDRDADGQPLRMLGVAFDVTEARQASSLVRQTRDRLEVLSAVSSALSAPSDVEGALARVPAVIVPRLADFCIVSLIRDDGEIRDVGSFHRDPARRAVLTRFCAHHYEGLSASAWTLRSRRTGRMVTVPFPAWENVLPVLGNASARADIAELRPAFVVVVPLRVRGEVAGMLSLLNEVESGPFGPADQQVAAEVASRAAVALDAARTFSRQRTIAEALQHTLLTAAPVVAPWQVAFRYAASVDDVQVGGDWYDAFPMPDGSLVVTVGDVMGHDSAAAAQMADLRSTLRGIFFATSPDPATGLTTVDAALRRFDLRTSATVVVARLWADPDGGAQGQWSLAGHPPPVVVGPTGARVLTGPVDPPLGVARDLRRRTSVLVLAPGETLLCYTDGLVERHDEDIDVGIERLRARAAEVGPEPAALCEALLDLRETRAAHHGDDAALLAVRCGQQAGPPGPH